ncbi:hypothetical protein GCM10007385_08480 [Tateyamaria omphalii]|uniref:TetR/AcrR family transcriptional regulator n=1 Tax=Tateyamaria omphalii TaxID=299262 RepID=UPI0016782024|nr:TetR/AcrR family transcriptional regulator [Tateyamaria omphalii]GGX42963.1 hypothetical protein GCM10007385_08480 [Tateyamaria omphalii]
MSDDIEMRKAPSQARSKGRLDSILNAASKLIVQKGLPNLGVREIARHADINIATFYQFFPNKAALIRTLSLRHMEAVQSFLDGYAPTIEGRTAEDVIPNVLDAVLSYYMDNPDYLELWFAGQADPELRALNLEDSRKNAGAIAKWVQLWLSENVHHDHEALSMHIVLSTGQVLRHAQIVGPAEAEPLLNLHKSYILRMLGS